MQRSDCNGLISKLATKKESIAFIIDKQPTEKEREVLEEIDKLLSRSAGFLKKREKEFIESIRAQYIQKGKLSHGQQSWLDSLMGKYSDKNIEKEKLWTSSWGDFHRNEATKVAKYYKENPPYFSELVAEITTNPDFLLSKKQWDKFCENKYAKRIRLEYESEPKFFSGECIQVRRRNKVAQANYIDNANSFVHRKCIGDWVGFVLEVNAKPITRAAKGSRIYKILLAGETVPVFAHESDLKKKRGK